MGSLPRPSVDTPPALGLTRTTEGPQLAVLARHATCVEVALFDDAARERRVPLRRTAHGIWWDVVPDLVPGTRYGLRVDGPWAPDQGHRHNPAKLLLDPYAHGVEGEVRWGPEVYGHVVGEQGYVDSGARDDRDSAASMPHSVVLDHDTFDWGTDAPPRVPWTDTVIYEAHVRGLTMSHPDIPAPLRGTYAALGHPALIDHLTRLGITALELLPIHAFTSEPQLVERGLSNYWGYNTLGYFAPHTRYAGTPGSQHAADELKGAIKALHAAGIEVLLDVVYNHTAEQSSVDGPTLSWRGLDNRTYYRLDERGRDIDVTGCGNTLDLREPSVTRLVLDSLRHWVEHFHVDGFRFDLAPALARGRDDAYHRDHAFHVALQTDPVLAGVKLVAEPWDVGAHGWRTGQFPAPFAEWNDRYRDTARTFWLADVGSGLRGQAGHGVRELATRLAGSADLFADDGERRGPVASVNFVTAHDGFTLADLSSYERKHNEANGEQNRDGHGDNRSWNHGVEGPTDDPDVLRARGRSIRNLLATLLLSSGVPMLTAGDETGRTQRGNNNAYCQDNDLTWVRWGPDLEAWQHALLSDTQALVALRRELPLLRTTTFPSYDARPGQTRLRWYDESAQLLSEHQWQDAQRRTLTAAFDTVHEESQAVVLILHGGLDHTEVTIPTLEGVQTWTRRFGSDGSSAEVAHPRVGDQIGEAPQPLSPGQRYAVGPTSFTVLVGTRWARRNGHMVSDTEPR